VFYDLSVNIALQSEAIHNKDYSVVKTFKAAQVAFVVYMHTPILQLLL
jgi:hypothetical protein